jgi:hypothetical protein
MGAYGLQIIGITAALGLTVGAFMLLGPHAPAAIKRYEVIYFQAHMPNRCAVPLPNTDKCGF